MPTHMRGVVGSPSSRPATVATSRGCSAAIRAAVPPGTPCFTPSKTSRRYAGWQSTPTTS